MGTKVFSSKLENLAIIGEFVNRSARRAGLSEKEAYDVELAVDEAFTNIVEHSYGCEGEQKITCTCETISQGIKITLKDSGCDFNLNSVPTPSLGLRLEELKTRGVGVFLMRHVMDELEHEYVPGRGNILTLVKHHRQ